MDELKLWLCLANTGMNYPKSYGRPKEMFAKKKCENNPKGRYVKKKKNIMPLEFGKKRYPKKENV